MMALGGKGGGLREADEAKGGRPGPGRAGARWETGSQGLKCH